MEEIGSVPTLGTRSVVSSTVLFDLKCFATFLEFDIKQVTDTATAREKNEAEEAHVSTNAD